MTTLGIFGDSYASDQRHSYGDFSWPVLITDHYKVENFARTASSLDYSLDLFIKNHEKFNQVIFVTTTHFRLHYPFKLKRKDSEIYDHYDFWLSDHQMDIFLKIYEDENNIISNLKHMLGIYYNQANEMNIAVQYTALIKHIIRIRPDVILIPGCGFESNLKLWKELGYEWSLHDIYLHETHKVGITDDERWNKDIRPNHLTMENHLWVLHHVLSRLQGTFVDWDPSNSYYFKTRKDLEKYLRP